MTVTVEKSKLEGNVVIPPSKSHTIRALVIATLAKGTSVIQSPLDSGDTKACIDTCRLFGATVTPHDTEWVVQGNGPGPSVPDNIIDVKNSGTTLYIALGMASLCDGWTIFTGDEQIRSRPATHLLASLNELGAEAFSTRDNGCAPIAVRGILRGGKTSVECPTSQYLTSLLITCPLAQEDTEINVIKLNEVPYVTMTMNWLDRQNITYTHDNYKKILIKGRQKYMPFQRKIPADFSSATFFLCAAAITRSKLTLHGLDMNDSQGDKAVVDILQQMGCKIYSCEDALIIEGEELHGGEFDLNNIPDSLPALSVTACFAGGTTRLYNVAQARLKETDRISIMKNELEKMGASVEELPDGLVIKESILKGTHVGGHADHRVVMALTIAGLGAEGRTTIDTTEAVNITFPDFFTILKNITL
jgi:3-phosphoshikimate 1-carboxyvinyltransferase